MIYGNSTVERISISRAQDKDVDQIVEMHLSLFEEEANQYDSDLNVKWPEMFGREYFLKLISDENSICLLAYYEQQIVGFAAGYAFNSRHFTSTKHARLQIIYVKRMFQCLGVGTKLVENFIQWAVTNRVKKIIVSVYMSNELGICFYRKFGFEPQLLHLKMDIGATQTEPIQQL